MSNTKAEKNIELSFCLIEQHRLADRVAHRFELTGTDLFLFLDTQVFLRNRSRLARYGFHFESGPFEDPRDLGGLLAKPHAKSQTQPEKTRTAAELDDLFQPGPFAVAFRFGKSGGESQFPGFRFQ